jgi:protein-disulfide isomerase
MKALVCTLILSIACVVAAAQKPDEILATVGTQQIKLADLPPQVQQAVTSLPTRVFATRSAILDQMVNQRLLDAEAKALGTSAGKIISAEKAKVANPSDAEIKAVFDANQEALHGHSLEESKKQIISYLRREPEQKLIGALMTRLKTKYKYSAGKPVNSVPLAPADIVATVNGQAITAKEFEEFAAVGLFELNAATIDLVLAALNDAVYTAMVGEEAKSLKVDPSAVIASEITNKLKEFSNEERFALEDAFAKKLAAKYNPVVKFKAPEPIVQKISADDDPATGPADAPVTIVMFSDFQCPACAATHTVLKKTIAEFPGKVRLVVRDYPLESIHANAFNAARAAAAAHAQGKFFEYAEMLYARQDALDDASLRKYAAELGLNARQFELDFNAEKTAAEIRKDQADGDSYIVNGTPTIFVNGVRVRDLSQESFKRAIDRALGK